MKQKIGCGALILSTDYKGSTAHSWFEQHPKDTRILLLQRGNRTPTYPLYWGAPGGLHEEGEEFFETTEREVQEEAGLTFQSEREPFYTGSWENRELRYFRGTWNVGESYIRLSDNEAVGYGWFTADEALKLSLSFRYREAIEALAIEKIL